jgi:hypothetical protein
MSVHFWGFESLRKVEPLDVTEYPYLCNLSTGMLIFILKLLPLNYIRIPKLHPIMSLSTWIHNQSPDNNIKRS